LHAHLRWTHLDSITTAFSNGRTRTYLKIPTAVKSVLGLRHAWRRRAMAMGAMELTQADSSAVTAAMATIICYAKAHGGLAVAPWLSLSVREQLQFDVSNRISVLTWGRLLALMAARRTSLANLRKEAAAASGEAHHTVTNNAQGAFLLSPRAAIQARLGSLVAKDLFSEFPARESDCLSEESGSASIAPRCWD